MTDVDDRAVDLYVQLFGFEPPPAGRSLRAGAQRGQGPRTPPSILKYRAADLWTSHLYYNND